LKKKKLLIYLCATTIIALSSFTNIFNLHITKEKINNSIIKHVNSTDILNKNITHDNTELKMLINTSLDNDTSNSYYVQINDIFNGSLKKIMIENSVYYKYTFTANITLITDDSEYNTNVQSSIILEKVSNEYVIKSLDDFKQDISKQILTVKTKNSEDISKELSDISLIYQNENLDIQLHYPDYYTYTNNPINNPNETSDTISFYMDTDKTNNYCLITMSTLKNQSTSETIDDLLQQNYSLEENKFTTPQGLTFHVLKQNFKQDFNDIIETIYILDGDYKHIHDMCITVKINSIEEKTKITEVEEIIKSIK